MAVEHGPELLKQHRRSLLLASLILAALSIPKSIASSGLLSRPLASLLLWSIIGIVSYWMVSKPKVSYLRWVLVIECVIVGWHLAFFVMPKLYTQGFLQYIVTGLSFFVCILGLYFVLQLLRMNNPVKLKAWVLLSLICAVPISLIYFYTQTS
jgi:hypothetical protein